MKKEVQNWLDSARYDLETAGHLFRAGSYIYTVFMCHLALEKVLKAKVEEITGEEPPKTHDLEYLIGLAGLSLVASDSLSALLSAKISTDFQRIFIRSVICPRIFAQSEF